MDITLCDRCGTHMSPKEVTDSNKSSLRLSTWTHRFLSDKAEEFDRYLDLCKRCKKALNKFLTMEKN